MDHDRHDDDPPPFWRSRFGLGWLVLAAVAGWFLWTEHRAHLLGFLPYLFLLACPLMHLFMHRGHHHGSHHGRGPSNGSSNSIPPRPGDNPQGGRS
ncbi:MAG: DUF2933 domain-containing protein [Aquabacterium sp.]|nr:DUF2933 domain-containing protein [Aquabacterium sp.]